MDFKRETMKISVDRIKEDKVKSTLKHVHEALKVKGYDPINQIVAYIMSGDPTYITGYDNARVMISKLERDEILEELVKSYIENWE
ncbi:MAG: IreB family regulatory phosphoprotein [Clostridia bacterium]|nr:IreB family regulatory phosphoprotein [Clostridia bacterium]